jgi:uncharacterized protein (DUF2147 family)
MFRLTHLLISLRASLICALVLGAPPAIAATEQSPVGLWSTEDGHGVIQIEPCGDALCGRIVGIDRAAGEPMPTDVQGRPQCGLTIITDELPTSDGRWNGSVTDPRSGDAYHAQLWVDAEGRLNLRGYIGIPLLGQTRTWQRFTGRLSDACRFQK